MSSNITIINDPILGDIKYTHSAITFENRDLLTHPALATNPSPSLPANFADLSWKVLRDLNKQHEAEGKEETKPMASLSHMHDIHADFAAECRQKLHDIRARSHLRQVALKQSADAMEVHEQRDPSLRILASLYDGTATRRQRDHTLAIASQPRREIPASATDPTAPPSHAFITQQDLQVNFMQNVADAEKLATRLSGYCTFRGGLMAPLPGLPLAKAVRFLETKLDPQHLFIHDQAELKQHPQWPMAYDRMIRRSAPLDEILIYVSGSCPYQGVNCDPMQQKAGCGVVLKVDSETAGNDNSNRGFNFRLESRGPTGETHPPTNGRAELRAAIAAVACRTWIGEGWTEVTIASSSAYLVQGITEYIDVWAQRD
jgi:ribonuclease HI